ncbi:MAG: transcriptional regulator [Gemmatimonadetes bacterium]|nr:transcriptional regulator [Gemmatimonadota bacterium]
MTSTLQREIKQSRPFNSLEQEAMLSIERTSALLLHRTAETFKPFGITQTQYNVLRILRGAGSDGLCRNDIRERLISQVPDVTRLLDRMEEAGLIVRERDAADRRVVTTRITKQGLTLLDQVAEPVLASHRRALGHMSATQLESLLELLSLARATP